MTIPEHIKQTILQAEAEDQVLSQQESGLGEEIESLKDFIQHVGNPASSVLGKAIERAVVFGEGMIANLLTKGFEDVFGEGHKIEVEWSGQTQRAKSAALVETRPDGSRGDMLRTSGDSHVELAALLARQMAIYCWKGRLAQVLIENEALSNFESQAYVAKVLDMVRQVCETIEQQVILVSHASNLEGHVDNLILVGKEGNESYVRCNGTA